MAFSRPIQAGDDMDFYDVLLIGKTGKGKSSTADKLLVPTTPLLRQETVSDEMPGGRRVERQADIDENNYLELWSVDDGDEEDQEQSKQRLQNIKAASTSDNPHEKLYDLRVDQTGVYTSTEKCVLFSNQLSRVRVLDIPGFYGKSQHGSSPRANARADERIRNNGLGTMRKIVQIQKSSKVKFRRVLYFLPDSPINRAHMGLEEEIELMTHHFCEKIFDNMVLVATVPEHICRLGLPDDQILPQEKLDETKRFFTEVLKRFLDRMDVDASRIPDVPIIFLSANETCEIAIKKITEAPIAKPYSVLEFDSNTCSKCPMSVRIVSKQKMVCPFKGDDSTAIPYEQSKCHPLLVPKYKGVVRWVLKVGDDIGVRKVFSNWPVFSDEFCPECKGKPESDGCLRVNTEYKYDGRTITVDHAHTI